MDGVSIFHACNPIEYQNLSSTDVCLSPVILIRKVVDNRAKALSTAFLITNWNFFFAADHEEGCLRLSEPTHVDFVGQCDSERFPYLGGWWRSALIRTDEYVFPHWSKQSKKPSHSRIEEYGTQIIDTVSPLQFVGGHGMGIDSIQFNST
jgi:hypothetical protein